MKRPLPTLVLTVFVVSLGGLGDRSHAQQEPESSAPAPELVDRIVAVVDEDPILASDLDRAIGLGLVSPTEGETAEAFRRRVLDRMLEERLRAHEVDRFGFTEISPLAVEKATEALASNVGGRAEFERRLTQIGLTRDDVRQLVARQVMVLTYVDERLGARVFVSLDDIQKYYDSVLTPEMKRSGQALPELDQVREEIRTVLREQRLNQEIERWTEELRLVADIEDYFERPEDLSADRLIEVRSASD